jgi:hypothetical protein
MNQAGRKGIKGTHGHGIIWLAGCYSKKTGFRDFPRIKCTSTGSMLHRTFGRMENKAALKKGIARKVHSRSIGGTTLKWAMNKGVRL